MILLVPRYHLKYEIRRECLIEGFSTVSVARAAPFKAVFVRPQTVRQERANM